MIKPVYLTPDFAVCEAPTPSDIEAAAAMGFRSLLNNRPNGEEAGQITSKDEGQAARALGLAYAHVPATKLDLFSPAVAAAESMALKKLQRPILAHCKSGQRSAVLWAAAQVLEGRDVEQVIAQMAHAGFQLAPLRDELTAIVHAAKPARSRRAKAAG